jgi:hypothetical protein
MHKYLDTHLILKVRVMLRGLPYRSAGLAISLGRAQLRPPAAILLVAPGSAQRPTRRRLCSWRLQYEKDAMQYLKRCIK